MTSTCFSLLNLLFFITFFILVRCCFVTTKTRAEKFSQPKSDIVPCPNVEYIMEGAKIINISGKLRETACEVLYDEDNDHQCLSTMILDAIMKVNMDLRLKLAENILLIGGTAMLPGFKARLKEELETQLKCDRYKKLNIIEFKFHYPPSKDNYTAWLGGNITFYIMKWLFLIVFFFVGALYGSTEILSMKTLTRENYLKENKLPDWVNLKNNVYAL